MDIGMVYFRDSVVWQIFQIYLCFSTCEQLFHFLFILHYGTIISVDSTLKVNALFQCECIVQCSQNPVSLSLVQIQLDVDDVACYCGVALKPTPYSHFSAQENRYSIMPDIMNAERHYIAEFCLLHAELAKGKQPMINHHALHSAFKFPAVTLVKHQW